MRIGYLVHRALFAYSGGGIVHVMELVRALERAGHEVTLFASDSGDVLPRERMSGSSGAASPPGGKRLLRRIVGDSIWQRLRGLRHVSRARAARPLLEAAFRERGIAAVYERYGLYNSAGVDACRALGLPHVLEVNSTSETLIRYGDHTYDPAAARIERHAFSHTGDVLVVSAAVREEVVKQGAPPERVHVVPNGVDVARFRPDVDGSEVRDRNGLADRILIGMVAYFKRWHGLEQLCRVVEPTVAAVPEARFLLVGEGDRPGAVSDFVHERGLSALVSVTGRVDHDEIPQYVAAMDVTVIPHFHHHGSPLKLYEYMAAGKPTVAVAIGQITEAIEDGVTGVLVPPDDIEALQLALIRLARDAAGRRRMGAAARAWVERERSWDHVAARVVEMWETQRRRMK